MNKRLFTFGDSFCKYVWPMWPEVMAQSYEETTNYGLSGVGNLFIYSKFLDLYNKTQLGPDDTVIIQWTEPARFDHISPNDMEWAREGSISAERFLVPGFENLNSDATSYYKTLIYMQSVINMLQATGCKWYFFFISWESMVHRVGIEQDHSKFYQNATQHSYNNVLENVNKYAEKHFIDEISMVEYINPTFNGSNLICKSVDDAGNPIEFVDGHPTPIHFYDYIKKVVSKKISDLDLEKMKQFSNSVESLLRELCPGNRYDSIHVETNIEDFYKKNTFYKNTL